MSSQQLVIVSCVDPQTIVTENDAPVLSEADTANDAMDVYNHPRARKARILLALQAVGKNGRSFGGSSNNWMTFVQPSSKDASDNLFTELYGAVHDEPMLAYLQSAWPTWDALGEQFQDPAGCLTPRQSGGPSPPLVPINVALPRQQQPGSLPQRPSTHVMGALGYYCTDSGTPIFADLRAELQQDAAVVHCAVQHLLRQHASSSSPGNVVVYALPTHPGHHAAASAFGGYCYVNHVAAAARALQATYAKVAILDVDYHAGNGTTSIFYDDPTVLVVSLHCHPDHDYPFHSGFPDETGGTGAGAGVTLNLALPPGTAWPDYRVALLQGLQLVHDFGATVVLVSLGLDTHVGDPCTIRRAGFALAGDDYAHLGTTIGQHVAAQVPVLVLQEGGYRMEKIGAAAAHVVTALYQARQQASTA